MQKQIIYIDGPDCVGKTTLAHELVRSKKDHYIHNGLYESPAVAYQAYAQQLREFRDDEKYERLIIDRGVLAEIVYGLIMRNTEPDILQLKIIIGLMEQFDYTIIIALAPFGQTVIKWANRQDVEYVNQFEKFVLIYEMFKTLVVENELGLAVDTELMLYDYTSNKQVVIDYVNR